MLAALFAELLAPSVQWFTHVHYVCYTNEQIGYMLLIKIMTGIINSKTLVWLYK